MAKNTDKFSGLEQEYNTAKLLLSDLLPRCEDLEDHTHAHVPKKEERETFILQQANHANTHTDIWKAERQDHNS